MGFELPPIYPVTDKRLARKSTHLAILRELWRGGASLVQIRDKETPVRELLRDLLRCREYAEARNVTLILDDRCDLTLAAGLRGVHLGQDDLPPAEARALLGEGRIIGYSTHSLAQVRRARALPVQYIGFGPVFATATKALADPVTGLEKLRRACRAASAPVVAIGGIGLGQVRPVLEAGASSAAVISALLSAPSIARQMERFLQAAVCHRGVTGAIIQDAATVIAAATPALKAPPSPRRPSPAAPSSGSRRAPGRPSPWRR
ncbi:MAG: thiamine phosphate synthase [Acidobacteriota bacterium]|jgi:thiamine-phosphate diphosphorylase|nr:thiamine phosphate synthase [Acidobacteriota bacterium]